MKRNKIHITEIIPDVIPIILLSLPVKSLLKFRCVSKSWCYLIDSKRFVKNHLETSTNHPNFTNHSILTQIWNLDTGLEYLQQYPCEYMKSEACVTLKFDPNSSWNNLLYSAHFDHIVGFCNGLCCAMITGKDEREHYILLLNPATRKSIKYQTSKRVCSMMWDYYGFGFDECNDDYKVLLGKHPSRCAPLKHKVIDNNLLEKDVYLYSFKSNDCSMKMIDCPFGKGDRIDSGMGIFVEGKLHWLMGQDDDYDDLPSIYGLDIVCFDMKTETYGGVLDKSFRLGQSSRMGVLDGCLCAVSSNDKIMGNEVWVLKQYEVKDSWVKVMTIPYCGSYRDMPGLTALCMKPDGEVMFAYGDVFYIFDPKKDTFPRRIKHASFCQFNVCIQSLVSPPSPRCITI